MVHIAGLDLTIEGRYLRQICAWCGEVLLDYDLTRCASMDGSPPAMFKVGVLVEVDGNMRSVIEGPLPDNACSVLEITR